MNVDVKAELVKSHGAIEGGVAYTMSFDELN